MIAPLININHLLGNYDHSVVNLVDYSKFLNVWEIKNNKFPIPYHKTFQTSHLLIRILFFIT